MGSESCPYNLKGKETTGDHCPCFTMLETLASVWETKLWFSLHLLSMAFGRLGQMNKTKAMFKIILVLYMLILLCLISLSSNEHMSSCPCSIPQALYVLLPCSFFELLCCFIENNLSLSSFLPFLLFFLPFFSLLCFPLLYSLQRSPIPFVLHSFVWSPSSYPQHIRCPTNESRESGRAKGRAWCRALGTGFNEASLNEFTAFHWATRSHVVD